ncbi:unnamed protein product [Triticum turgidum subsp. durum]|uniref:Uncharacterized protein n=1 Tax=Triticum turgidum subsp. durum TaxID=4567 RepID=A0A9R0YE75_TRITD|nr:unnamed protein product [Triticum turgidum subsp. durum]
MITIVKMGESRGSIAFFACYRPPVPLDIFCCPASASSRQDERHLTDGVSYNYNGQPIPSAALKAIVKHLDLAPEDVEEAAIDSGRLTGLVFVSERQHHLETLQIGLRFDDGDEVRVFTLGDIYGGDFFSGARLEDSGCIAGGYEVDGHTADHYLVFVSTKEPVQERRSPWNVVYKTNLRTGETERLTPPGTSDLSPSVSPSGKRIAVASFQGKKWDGEVKDLLTSIYVMDLESTYLERERVIENAGWPSWGSETVLFFHKMVGDNWGVFRYDLSTGETLRVTPEAFDAVTPAAIDESRVAVATIRQKSVFTDVRTEAQYRHIEIFDMSLPEEPLQITRYTKPKGDHYNPFVMDGGKYIGYHRCKSDHLEHGDDVPRRFDKLQSHHEDIGLFRVAGAFPAFSKDGSKLAFVDNEFKAVWLADSDGMRVVFETDGPDGVFSPVWNQKKDILYVCMGPSFKANEILEIYAIPHVSSGARERRLLTKGKFNNAFPSTNSDGTKLVFRSTRNGGDKKYKNLYMMDAEIGEDGGEAERITEGDWIDTHCQWSPDRDWIVFSSNRDRPADAPERDHGMDPGYFAVYLMNAIDYSVVRVIRSGYDFSGHVNHPVFSPDGRSIVVTADLAAVSADPMSLPLLLHSQRPYSDIFTVDIDPDDMEKNQDVEEFARVTHSRYENATPDWTVFSTHDPHAQWNLLVMEDNYTPACPYAHHDGGESWHMTGQMCIPKRVC